MSGETEKQVSGWTVDTLHSHLSTLLSERDRRYSERFDAIARDTTARFHSSQEAIAKAEIAQRGVNERQNEFRGQLSDQAATLMPRKEAEALTTALRETLDREVKLIRADVQGLRESRSEGVGNKGGQLNQRELIGWVVGLIATGIMVYLALRGR